MMKSFKLFLGTCALLLGINSIATWAAEEAADKTQDETVKKDNTGNETAHTGEPICGGIDE